MTGREPLDRATLPPDVADAWRSLTCLAFRPIEGYDPDRTAWLRDVMVADCCPLARVARRLDYYAETAAFARRFRRLIRAERESVFRGTVRRLLARFGSAPPEVRGPLEAFLEGRAWTCLRCGRTADLAGDDYCPTCGEPLPELDAREDADRARDVGTDDPAPEAP